MSKPRIVVNAGPSHAIGLMSGTSHDGVSAALVRFGAASSGSSRGDPAVKLIAFQATPYRADFRRRLMDASAGAAVGAAELSSLNFELGRAFGRAALKLIRAAGVAAPQVSFIGSHGHTFFHLPPSRARRRDIPSTLQLGEPAVIAALTGLPVVSDFRPMDMALGGEAAPLAPLAHLRLFGDRKRGRAVQNIGGIGNVTYLPPGASMKDPRIIAFDTGPGNMLIDLLAERLTDGRMRMDRDGRMAAQGRVHKQLLDHAMREPYFKRKPPKSTGREEFGAAFLARIEQRARKLALSGFDLIASITALTARSIADSCRRFIAPLGPVGQIIVTGGGAHNRTLIAMLKEAMPQTEVLRAEDLGVSGDALEAIAFAILGREMLRGCPGNLPSVTGAADAAVLGKLTMPPEPARTKSAGASG